MDVRLQARFYILVLRALRLLLSHAGHKPEGSTILSDMYQLSDKIASAVNHHDTDAHISDGPLIVRSDDQYLRTR